MEDGATASWHPRVVQSLTVLLTVGTGAMDAIGFLRLGDVFTSVMTGNLVLLGLAAGRADVTLIAHVGVAVGGYVFGAFCGGLLVNRSRGTQLWPTIVTIAFAVELALLVAFAAVWFAVGGDPDPGLVLGMLALAATAMGMQSAAVRRIGLPNLSTTYMTGTLTGLVADLARRSPGSGASVWAGARLAALVCGAAVCALLLQIAAPLAPVLPVGLLVAVMVTALVANRFAARTAKQ
ncbi:MAG: YoaK family protein [Streptosporangiales bacterium]